MDKQHRYEFSPFRLDTEKRRLFRGGEIVALTPKAYDLLVVLIERRGVLVTYNELKKLAWAESSFVEDKTLTQTIYTLRALLGDSSKEQKYIENVPKRGYRFAAEVILPPAEETVSAVPNETPEDYSAPAVSDQSFGRRKILTVVFTALIISSLAALLYWRSASRALPAPPFSHGSTLEAVRSPSDEAAIKQLIEESQKYESLTIDAAPMTFDEQNLPDYWLSPELGGKEILKVRSSLKRLQEKGLHYGSESRNERFEMRYVRVFSMREYAEAGTIERWFLPLYRADGSRVEGRNEYLGTYEIDYALRKINGQWLIEETSTPRYEDKK